MRAEKKATRMTPARVRVICINWVAVRSDVIHGIEGEVFKVFIVR